MGFKSAKFEAVLWNTSTRLYDYKYSIIGILAGLLLWELAGVLLPTTLFAGFIATLTFWVEALTSGVLIDAVLQSLQHAVLGFVLAVVVGIPLGFFMGRRRQLYWALEGPLNALYATPFVALIPLFAVWFGLGLWAKTVVVFLMAFIELTFNVFQGVRDSSDQYDVISESFDASWFESYRLILLPAILPFIFAGLRLAVGRSVRGMIVAELFLEVEGLGELLTLPQYQFQPSAQLAFIATVTLIGVLAQMIVKLLNKQVVHWPAEAGRGE